MTEEPRGGRTAIQPANDTTAPAGRAANRTVFRFIALFLLYFLGFEALIYGLVLGSGLFETYLAWNAWLSSLLLLPFVDGIEATGSVLASPGFALAVRPGCDALQPCAVFLAGVLSFPATARQRTVGACFGVILLLALNLVRISSLFLIGTHLPEWFDSAHIELWQGAFIVAALLLWLFWARRVSAPASPAD